ncbi:hypothetical protein ABT294_18545 [Nonomuraea sp. NPDC000554]|uniref:hypothetical protein n=1 Tax=Nonomuraea sp. NPDC000554 TaxID=3154259 RepID=UPI003330F178
MYRADQRLDEILDALDTNLPAVRYRIRRFPEGTGFLLLISPDATRSTLFAQDGRWFCLTETSAGAAFGRDVGRVGDPPDRIVGRVARPARPRRPASGPVRVARAFGVGLSAGLGAGVLAALVMAIAVLGNGYGYGSDTVQGAINVLAAVIGVGVGIWLALRSWRSGRGLAGRGAHEHAQDS